MRPKLSNHLAIALQTWNGDIAHAMLLAQLICDLEPVRRTDIEVLLPFKLGTDRGAVDALKRIFETKFGFVLLIEGKRRSSGWPSSCNDLWQCGMSQMARLYKAGKLKADAVLTFEPDCLPLQPDWLDRLKSEWHRAREQDKLCIGHVHSFPSKKDPTVLDDPTHINGNAIFSLDVLTHHPELAMSRKSAGWDAEHGKLLLKIGLDTPEIHQLYRIREALTKEDLAKLKKGGRRPALFHGAKNPDCVSAARELLFEKNEEG